MVEAVRGGPADFFEREIFPKSSLGGVAGQTTYVEDTRQFFETEDEADLGAAQRAFAQARGFAHADAAVMHHETEAERRLILERFEPSGRRAHGGGRLIAIRPVGEEAVAEVFVEAAAVFLEDGLGIVVPLLVSRGMSASATVSFWREAVSNTANSSQQGVAF